MKIEKIFSFLTYPGKNKANQIVVSGTLIPINDGKLCKMLSDIFVKSELECNIPIAFTSDDGKQSNVARAELLEILNNETIAAATPLATRLQLATTETSGMGLLFFCLGSEGQNKKIVISRFPADEGVVAEKQLDKLTVSFVEQVFLKSSFSYKSVMYKGNSTTTDFWTGYAVDKQINHGTKAIAEYWIADFLKSDFKTTSAAGTKRLAIALKDAISGTSDPNIKHEIASSVGLAKNMPDKSTTIEGFCDHFHLSQSTKEAVCKQVRPARLLKEPFKFEQTEFSRHISYKLIELDNGAVLSAQLNKFDDCFKTTSPKKKDGVYTFTTTGHIIDEKLRKTK